MVRLLAVVLAFLTGAVFAADDKGYTCSMKVANPVRDSSMSKSGGGKGGGASTKTIRQKFTWPVTVSFQGKEIPKSGVVLKFHCLGMTDGSPEVLESSETPVALDEKGKFKTEFSSPLVTMTKTKKAPSRNGGDSGGSKATGQSVSGCIVQLVVGDKVERVFATKPAWAKLAKTNPIPSEELAKLR